VACAGQSGLEAAGGAGYSGRRCGAGAAAAGEWHVSLVWRAIGVLVAALAVLGCSSTGQDAEGAWGKAEDGFRAMLHSPRALLKEGEQIEIRIRIRNTEGEIRDFPSSGDLVLKLSRSDKDLGDDVDYVTLAPEAIKLAPGEERDFLLRRYPTAGPQATLCRGPGAYRFRGTFRKLDLPPLEVRVQ